MWFWFLKNKLLILIGSLFALGLSFFIMKEHYIQVGYDRASSSFQATANIEIAKATQLAIEKAEIDIEEALSRQRKIFELELARERANKKIETIIEEVITYVDRVEIKTECTDLGIDVIELLNKAIRADVDTHN